MLSAFCLQLQYSWQALTLEGSPFKQDKVGSHLMPAAGWQSTYFLQHLFQG
jgi:hypothetical protein